LIHSFGRDFEPFNTFSAEFRAGLARQSPQPVDFFDVALASARFDNREEGAFVGYLSALFAGHRLDLVVPMGAPAVGFAQKYRARLFPDTPMILASVDQRMVKSSMLTTSDAVIAVRHDMAGLVQAMLRLMPGTTNVVIVFGNSPLERFWSNEFMRESGLPANRITCESFSGLSFEQMKQRAAALPRGSVMLFGDLLVDVDGIPMTGNQALAGLHEVANAPIFGIHDFQLGHGIVGGPLVAVNELAGQTASAAARILKGEPPARFRPPPLGESVPTYDWRELQRWNIAEQRLPAGSVIEYRSPTTWERYRFVTVTGGSVVVAQAALIAGLAFNLRRRRKAEQARNLAEERAKDAQAQAERLQQDLAHVSRVSMLGELAGALAHELNQPLTAIVCSGEAAQALMNGDPRNDQELSDVLKAVVEQGQRAGKIIAGMRAMLRKAPEKMGEDDVNLAVKEVLQMLGSDLVLRGVTLVLKLDPNLPLINGHGVQLRQVLLNLVINACDAMADMPENGRQLTIESRRMAQEVEVSLTDSGPGFSKEMLQHVFEPFQTTKAKGLGLGLTICQTIVRMHGGRLVVANNGDKGAIVRFTLSAKNGTAYESTANRVPGR
jgi:signal transduction histidine kinase